MGVEQWLRLCSAVCWQSVSHVSATSRRRMFCSCFVVVVSPVLLLWVLFCCCESCFVVVSLVLSLGALFCRWESCLVVASLVLLLWWCTSGGVYVTCIYSHARSLLCLCHVFRALVRPNSLVCWFCRWQWILFCSWGILSSWYESFLFLRSRVTVLL